VSTNPVPPISADSSHRGFLAPTNLYGLMDDQDLARYLQQMVAGITGLDPTLVRPSWQPEPPDEPEVGTTWCSIRKEDFDPETFAWEGNTNVNGQDVHLVVRHEMVNLVAQFQGPQSERTADFLSLGFQLAQNREYFTRSGYGFVESGKKVVLPLSRNERYLYVVDLPFTLRRRQQVDYAVHPLTGATAELIVDQPPAVYPLVVSNE
jgi:hypothetical protein